MTRAELLARIKKCLALAKSANEHEAAAALAKARALMDEYGVDQADVELADVGEAIGRGGKAQTPPLWEAVLARSVTRAIPCARILNEGGWAFIGITPAPEIASYAFTVLYRQLKAARAAYIISALRRCTPARKRKRADAFCEGWALAVYNQVAKLYPEQPIDELVRTYLAKRYTDVATISARKASIGGRAAEDDRDRGWAAGRDVRLQHGVGGAARQLLLA